MRPVDARSERVRPGEALPPRRDGLEEHLVGAEEGDGPREPGVARRRLHAQSAGEGPPPGVVAVADGQDDFGLGVERHEVRVDVAAGGVDRGEVAAHVAFDALAALCGGPGAFGCQEVGE